jgi:hypothetical protein
LPDTTAFRFKSFFPREARNTSASSSSSTQPFLGFAENFTQLRFNLICARSKVSACYGEKRLAKSVVEMKHVGLGYPGYCGYRSVPSSQSDRFLFGSCRWSENLVLSLCRLMNWTRYGKNAKWEF